MKLGIFLASVAGLASTFATASATVTLAVIDPNDSNTNVFSVGDATALGNSNFVQGTGVVLGSTTLNYNLTNSTGTAKLTISNSGIVLSDILNQRTSISTQVAANNVEHVHVSFSVDVPTDYSFSGNYTLVNTPGNAGRANLQYAFTQSGSALFSGNLFSTFNDGANPFTVVPQTGTLQPGTTYLWDIVVSDLAVGSNIGTSNGSGSFALNFVPAPSAMSLLAASGCVALRRRRK